MKNTLAFSTIMCLVFFSCKDDDSNFSGTAFLNPSFEGTPVVGVVNGELPKGLTDCGFAGQSTPDIHPGTDGGYFGVTQTPYDGDTYLGLVVRDNETWESISMELNSSLSPNESYDFSIALCRSLTYQSVSPTSQTEVNYATPCILRIWGGASACDRSELLAESELIVNSNWVEYAFEISPSEEIKHVVLEAFYKAPTTFPYNGNLLLDGASGFIPR